MWGGSVYFGEFYLESVFWLGRLIYDTGYLEFIVLQAVSASDYIHIIIKITVAGIHHLPLGKSSTEGELYINMTAWFSKDPGVKLRCAVASFLADKAGKLMAFPSLRPAVLVSRYLDQ
jgi:hypothetical protein